MPGPDAEEDLAGGNVGGARRRGDVVVRPGGPWSPTVQALLAHLVASGLTGVPEPRGIDPDGSDLTEYLEGTVPTYPMPPWVWVERNVTGAARWLRQFHDISVEFPARTHRGAHRHANRMR